MALEIDLSPLNDEIASLKLLENVDKLSEEGHFILLIDRDPDPIIKKAWAQRPGRFACYLESSTDSLMRIRVEEKKSCCGSCH